MKSNSKFVFPAVFLSKTTEFLSKTPIFFEKLNFEKDDTSKLIAYERSDVIFFDKIRFFITLPTTKYFISVTHVNWKGRVILTPTVRRSLFDHGELYLHGFIGLTYWHCLFRL